MFQKITLFVAIISLLVACQNAPKQPDFDVKNANWQQIEARAKGSTVQFTMWQGDPLINKYMADYVVPEVKKRFDIDLKINAGQGNDLVKMLLGEREANKSTSAMDMCWINGETFFQLRQINALQGAFTSQLPNSQYINFDNPFIKYDFQQPVDGMECPWGNVQMAIIYDTIRTPQPPLSMEALETYVKAHPNRFTIPYEFTGMTLLKSWLIGLSGSKDGLNGAFDEKKYAELSTKLWDFINRNKQYFWRKGETFPDNLSAMHQMFANGELDFTMSNNDGEVDNKILQNIFPKSAKAYVFTSGTIQNSHFLGIPALSGNKAGAMTVINFMISPEAQFQKYTPSVWGDGTVLDIKKLPTEWQEKFKNLPERTHSPKRSDIQDKALQEPASEYMIRLSDDFRKKVIEKK
jgi:putative spermidine/putrescine transport system substrate-binding protein